MKRLSIFSLFIAVLLSFLFNVNVLAAEWRIIAAADWPPTPTSSTMVEVDSSSVRQREGFRQAWVRYSFNPSKPTYFGKMMASAASLYLFDCKNDESSIVSYLEYSKAFGQGEVGYQQSEMRAEAIKHMTTVVPNSYGETVLRWVCAQPVK